MEKINELMNNAVSERIFPGANLIFSLNGNILYNSSFGLADLDNKKQITQDTIFDLASLTKPIATTIAIMYLVQKKALKLDQNIRKFIPKCAGTDLENILIQHLLCHCSGLKAWTPFYKKIYKYDKKERKNKFRQLLLKEELINPPGFKTLYSDIGFMFLEWIIEIIVEKPMDQFIQKEIYEKLGLYNLFFIDLFSNQKTKKYSFASTEKCPYRNKTLTGEVHDDNAYSIGGICGHAGLFGDIKSVHEILLYLLRVYHKKDTIKLLDSEIVQLFLSQTKCLNRTYGFDVPEETNSSSGKLFSKNTAGHLGFTGTSFWMDLDRSIIVVLLTNRVHPSRNNNKIKVFRPLIHDAIMNNILNN